MARNSSGTYSLPSGNPVVSGTTISSTVHNNTLNDLAGEITDSLSRSGKGAMTSPLEVPDGTVALPSLTFDNDPDSGLYRAASNDVAMASGGVQAQRWLITGAVFPLVVTTQAGITGTQTTSNGNGAQFTGNGVGSGVNGTGGSNSGGGGTFTGGASNGNGVNATGDGTGSGVSATGGDNSGAGGTFLGGATNGNGVAATGDGTGAGVSATGGDNAGFGGVFTGGATNGTGLSATGNGTGKGATFANGTAAVGATPRTAAELSNGYLAFGANAANPNSTVGFNNTLTPMNLPKAWARVSVASGTPSITSGFNIASVALSGTTICRLTLTTGTAAANGAVLVTLATSSQDWIASGGQSGTTTIDARFYDISGTAEVNLTATDVEFSILLFGAQTPA